jgi:predicted DNA-binding transcriptional regulator
MSKDQALGALIAIVCAFLIIAYIGLLFLYNPYIKSWLNLGATSDVQFWLIAVPVLIGFVGILLIGAWIGWTMATTPPPKPIEEINTQTEDTKTTSNNSTNTPQQ